MSEILKVQKLVQIYSILELDIKLPFKFIGWQGGWKSDRRDGGREGGWKGDRRDGGRDGYHRGGGGKYGDGGDRRVKFGDRKFENRNSDRAGRPWKSKRDRE